MFTGIIEEIGIVEKIVNGKLMHIIVRAELVLDNTKIGDSISVNGACLTVVDLDKRFIGFDIIKETQEKSNLSTLKTGERVNLERAMSVNTRFGGHIVSGHIDDTGIIEKKTKYAQECLLQIQASKCLLSFLVPKGSIAIDGVSLTVVEVKEKSFTVFMIPHTLNRTTLGFKKSKDKVNLETDILSKYVFLYFEQKQKTGSGSFSKEYLKKAGYIDD
ncbi:MAG: riboflavin synthase [Candidatus Omnitrophica bacterium]|nr:riboflavin synthase [Candidatus Omnitrophota bacterium]